MEKGKTLTSPPPCTTPHPIEKIRTRWMDAATQIQIVCCLFIILFVYTGVSKLLDTSNFSLQISRSPVLGVLKDYSGIIAWLLPLSEILIAVSLIIPGLQRMALRLAVVLMVMFTGYIVVILNFAPYVPCICGGVLETLSWKEHLAFNFFFVVIGVWAIIKQSDHVRHAVKE